MSYGQYAASPHCLPRIAFAKMEVVCMSYVFLLRVIKLLACFDSLTRLLHAEWHKKPLHVHNFAPSRRILNPQSEEIVLAESGIFRGFGIRNAAQGIPLTIEIQNPTSTDKDWNPVPGIRNPRRGIQNPRLSWIPL